MHELRTKGTNVRTIAHPQAQSAMAAHRRILPLYIVIAFLGIAGPSNAQSASGVVRVSPAGGDVQNCGSAIAPCRTLQFAVDEFPLPGAGTILVAAGTYTSTDPTQVVRITLRRIRIEGGYSADFSSRDADAFPVLIDGENQRKGIVADCPMASVDPCHLTLVGVTLTRGNATVDLGTLNAFGGGLDAFETTVILSDVDVTNNRAQGLDSSAGLPGDGGGGGLSFRSSTAFLSRVTFAGNVAQGGAGSGIANRGGLGVGGGIFSIGSIVNMNNVSASGNMALGGDAPTAFGAEGPQRADGLGGFWALIDSSGAASDLIASNNRAEGGVGSLQGGLGLGGAIFIQIASRVTLHGIDLRNNAAIGAIGGTALGGGGGIFSEDALLEIDRGNIIGNLAQGGNAPGATGGTGGGGGVYVNSSLPQANVLNASNLIIASNDVVAGDGTTQGFAFGGGIFSQCPQGPPPSCKPMTASISMNLDHVTLADNSVSNATFNQGAALYVSSDVVVNSNFGIVTGHDTPMTVDDRGEAILTFGDTTLDTTLYQGNTRRVFAAPGGSFVDTNPLSGTPDYIDPLGMPADYHILGTSAAIGQATDSTRSRDVDNEVRPDPSSGTSDVGADEHYAIPTPANPTQGLFASVFDNGKLLHIDTTTGAGHMIGIGPVGLVGLAAQPGRLFGLGVPDQLIEFDPTDGSVLAITTPGIELGDEGAMTFDSSGTGFAVRGTSTPSELWSFDPSGGSPVQLNADLSDSFDGLAFNSNDDLFGLSQSLVLFDVDSGGGAPVSIGPTGLSGSGVAGLSFSDQGTLFGAIGNELYSIDTGNGSSTSIGTIEVDSFGASGISGLAYVPEPNPQLLSGAALVALLILAGLGKHQTARVDAR
jgi:hypothetical protein